MGQLQFPGMDDVKVDASKAVKQPDLPVAGRSNHHFIAGQQVMGITDLSKGHGMAVGRPGLYQSPNHEINEHGFILGGTGYSPYHDENPKQADYARYGPQFGNENADVWNTHSKEVTLNHNTPLHTAQHGLRNAVDYTGKADMSFINGLENTTPEDFESGKVPLPSVIKQGGRLTPVDGHHRIVRQRQLGMEPKVRLLDLDEHEDKFPDPYGSMMDMLPRRRNQAFGAGVGHGRNDGSSRERISRMWAEAGLDSGGSMDTEEKARYASIAERNGFL